MEKACLDQHHLGEFECDEIFLPSCMSSYRPQSPFLALGETRTNNQKTGNGLEWVKRGTG